MGYKASPSSASPLKRIFFEFGGQISKPPVNDILVSTVYRDYDSEEDPPRPLVTGAILIAGQKTREECPLTRLDPVHFAKIYHPGGRAPVNKEFDLTHDAWERTGNFCVPKPLGYAIEEPLPLTAQAFARLGERPGARCNVYRARLVPGKTLAALSPFRQDHYLGNDPDSEAAFAKNWPKASLQALWQGLEEAACLLRKLHKKGMTHGDAHRHNIMFSKDPAEPGHLIPTLIDLEGARYKESMSPEQWKLRVEDDFDEVLREAIVLQKTALGPQRGNLARQAAERLPELFPALKEKNIEEASLSR